METSGLFREEEVNDGKVPKIEPARCAQRQKLDMAQGQRARRKGWNVMGSLAGSLMELIDFAPASLVGISQNELSLTT